MISRAEVFLAHTPPDERAAYSDVSALESVLHEQLEDAFGAWPSLDVDHAEFLAHLAMSAADGRSGAPGPERLRRLHVADLYLAFACAEGDRRALAEIDRRFLSEVASFIARIDSSAAFADEVKQLLRKKLFVPEASSRAKILDYAGTGPLGGWLRVAAVRTARNLLRSARPARAIEGGDASPELRSPGADPELAYFKQRYGRELREAFQATLESLPAREKNVLRMSFIDGMSSNAIGSVYGVTGAAVRVWIKKWRELILDETRKRLAERLQVGSRELESVMRLAASEIDVSISRLLPPPG